MERIEIINKHSDVVFKWLNYNQLNNTMENIRRYYALKHGAIPNEKTIDEIYECISMM